VFGVGFSFWFSGLRLAASSSALLRVVSVAHVLANSYEEVDYNVPQPAWIKDTYQWSCTLLKMGCFAEKPITMHLLSRCSTGAWKSAAMRRR